MTPETDQRNLAYILQSIDLIERRTRAGKSAFLQNVDVQDAVLWRLETLAEATGKLSPELKQRHAYVRWRAIYGFRNVAAHGYLELQLDLVREIVERHLAGLQTVARQELARDPHS